MHSSAITQELLANSGDKFHRPINSRNGESWFKWYILQAGFLSRLVAQGFTKAVRVWLPAVKHFYLQYNLDKEYLAMCFMHAKGYG